MDSHSMVAEPAGPSGVAEGASPRRRSWIKAAPGAVAFAVLALLVYAFPGDLTAPWTGGNVMGETLLDQRMPAQHDPSGSLYADLERHLRWQPNDVRALVFKARLDMKAQRYDKAAAAYRQAVAGNSKAALDPDIWVEYAEALGMAQGRTLAGEPLKLVHKALSLKPNHAQALDMAGSAAYEARDFAGAAAYWKQLLAQMPAGTTMHAQLSRAIERTEQRARTSLPPSPAASAQAPGAAPALANSVNRP